jgi:hypothetical protein
VDQNPHLVELLTSFKSHEEVSGSAIVGCEEVSGSAIVDSTEESTRPDNAAFTPSELTPSVRTASVRTV